MLWNNEYCVRQNRKSKKLQIQISQDESATSVVFLNPGEDSLATVAYYKYINMARKKLQNFQRHPWFPSTVLDKFCFEVTIRTSSLLLSSIPLLILNFAKYGRSTIRYLLRLLRHQYEIRRMEINYNGKRGPNWLISYNQCFLYILR